MRYQIWQLRAACPFGGWAARAGVSLAFGLTAVTHFLAPLPFWGWLLVTWLPVIAVYGMIAALLYRPRRDETAAVLTWRPIDPETADLAETATRCPRGLLWQIPAAIGAASLVLHLVGMPWPACLTSALLALTMYAVWAVRALRRERTLSRLDGTAEVCDVDVTDAYVLHLRAVTWSKDEPYSAAVLPEGRLIVPRDMALHGTKLRLLRWQGTWCVLPPKT